jgi:hypothetical protein
MYIVYNYIYICTIYIYKYTIYIYTQIQCILWTHSVRSWRGLALAALDKGRLLRLGSPGFWMDCSCHLLYWKAMDLSADFNGISWGIHRDLMGFNGKLMGI